MLPLESPDRIHVAFDDHRLVANAGLLLTATLALRLGLGELVDQLLDLGHAPGRANTGDKLLTLVASALAGGDCIDDADALRSSGDRDGETLELEADHRRRAEIENAIRDLKYGVGLNHLPSGRFAANAAWLAIQVMAHNLARWTQRIALGETVATTKTLRRRFLSLAGRITRKARQLTLHLPRRWPWETQFVSALVRLRAISLPA